MNRYLKMFKEPISLGMDVINNLDNYNKRHPPFQPDILMGEKPKKLAALLHKDKNHLTGDEKQFINAWRHWRAEHWQAEDQNESSLRLLFRAALSFKLEAAKAKDETTKNKYSECMLLVVKFLKDEWSIHNAMDILQVDAHYALPIKKLKHLPGLSNEWRDPVGYIQ